MKFVALLVLLTASLSFAQHGQAASGLTNGIIDFPALDQELQGNGLTGWVHGAAPEFNQYVFTWRDPNDFFLHFEFPMITSNPKLKAVLKTLGRHDEIVIKGKFANLNAPVRHIRLTDVQVSKKFDPGIHVAHYAREAKLPDDLEGKKELIGKVHAVVEDGHIFVIEYKDAVIPVYAKDNQYTKDLYRNDKIKLQYVLRQHPGSPSHVELDPASTNPVHVIEKLVDLHGQPVGPKDPKTGKALGLDGVLVMFPKSPQVKFNVFALQVTDTDGVKREHTLVNFDVDHPEIFLAIRDHLQKLWDAETSTIVDARNKYINPKIRLHVEGTGNVVDPGQANPQVLLTSEKDITRLP